MNRIPDNSNNRLDQIDLFSDGIINRRPDADKEVFDTSPDGYKKVLYSVDYACDKAFDPVPDINEKGLNAVPYIYPEFLYFAKTRAEQITQQIQIVFQRIFEEIPYRYKNALYTVPYLIPITRENADKHIEEIQDDICNSFEDICDLLKCSLKNRFQELAEPVPYSLDDLTDIFEIEAQCVDTVNDALTES